MQQARGLYRLHLLFQFNHKSPKLWPGCTFLTGMAESEREGRVSDHELEVNQCLKPDKITKSSCNLQMKLSESPWSHSQAKVLLLISVCGICLYTCAGSERATEQ